MLHPVYFNVRSQLHILISFVFNARYLFYQLLLQLMCSKSVVLKRKLNRLGLMPNKADVTSLNLPLPSCMDISKIKIKIKIKKQ